MSQAMPNNPVPDSRDVTRDKMIAGGYVPSDCLLRGEVVQDLVEEGIRPCDSCRVDRARCSGTPLYQAPVRAERPPAQSWVTEIEPKVLEQDSSGEPTVLRLVQTDEGNQVYEVDLAEMAALRGTSY